MRAKFLFYAFLVASLVLTSCEESELAPVEKPEETPEDPAPPAVTGPKLFVAGYLPHYGLSRFDQNALEHLDRVYYFSVSPDSDGKFSVEDMHTQNIQSLYNKTQHTGTELFLVVGGWYESENIFPMAADSLKREAYTNALVQYCIENKIDGVDLDWESYPTPVPENDYLALVDVLSDKLRANNLLFTIAVAARHHELSAKFINKADQINIMSYGIIDSGGNQVTLETLKGWLDEFSKAGIPENKLIIGVPFYGKRPNSSNNNSPRSITYANIIQKVTPGYYDNKYGSYAFNGRGLMHTKTKYLRENGYFGIMSWELSQDVEYASKFSLLRSITEVAK